MTAKHFIIVSKLAEPDDGLVRLAAGVERYDLQLLAHDAAAGIDLVDGDLRRDFIRARQRRERAGKRGKITERQIIGLRRSAEAQQCGCGEQPP